ncbi:TPA: helix-turn-helix domain-containing protein [Salmonella enterica subsp. salamae serovar 48:z:e,n,x,z15]|nr:helix-turn-helix domain-containing protein [Salmonella enterica subsp. salamae serovar 48:z:e,n,x,z15]
MSRAATDWAWSLELKASQKLLMLSLADRADESHCCYPSIQRLVKDTGMDKKTISKWVGQMIDDGLITDTGERKGKTKQVRVLRLNIDGKENQKRNDTENGKHPNFGQESIPNLDFKASQKRVTESVIEPVKEPLERKRKPSSMPEGFSPSASHQKMAEEFGISLQDEFDKFTDHHLSKGSKFIDWSRALNTWLRNARGFQKSRSCNSFSRPSSAITVSKTGYVFFDR